MTRIQFSMKLGIWIVVGHVIYALVVAIAAFVDGTTDLLEVLKITVPVTLAYSNAVLTWFGRFAGDDAPRSRRKIATQEVFLYRFFVGAFFLALLIPVILYLLGGIGGAGLQFSGENVEIAVVAVEIVFGSGLAIIMRTLFQGET